MESRAERIGHLDGLQLATGGRDDVEQDLEALRRKRRRELLKAVAADHEKAAHGIGDLDAQHALCHFRRKGAGAGPVLIETIGAAALDIAAADHELGGAALQQRQHLWQLRLVMLKVGIHHRGIGRAGGEDALDAGARQAAPADPADAADPAVLPRKLPHDLPGTVGGVVVDIDDFPSDAFERRLQLAEQLGDVVALLVSGDDNGQHRCSRDG